MSALQKDAENYDIVSFLESLNIYDSNSLCKAFEFFIRKRKCPSCLQS